MLNLANMERDDDVTTLGRAKNMRIVICTDSPTATPPDRYTDLYIYNGTTALSATNYITLPAVAPFGKVIHIRSLNGNLYVQSNNKVFTLSGTEGVTAPVSIGTTQMRSVIYTSLGWISGY